MDTDYRIAYHEYRLGSLSFEVIIRNIRLRKLAKGERVEGREKRQRRILGNEWSQGVERSSARRERDPGQSSAPRAVGGEILTKEVRDPH